MTNQPLRLEFNFYGDVPSITTYLTWGIHKELSEVLLKDDNFLALFSNPEVANEVLKICLAVRDQYGRKISDFEFIDMIDMLSMSTNLELIFKYFEDFFFQNQQRMLGITQKMKSLQAPTNT